MVTRARRFERHPRLRLGWRGRLPDPRLRGLVRRRIDELCSCPAAEHSGVREIAATHDSVAAKGWVDHLWHPELMPRRPRRAAVFVGLAAAACDRAGRVRTLPEAMMPGSPLVVALEGPSDSGKTTLARGLRETLGRRVVLLPCYADLAGDAELPPAVADDVTAQLEGLDFYLDIDRERRRSIAECTEGSVVIADRSWLGLLAHVYAVQLTGGPAAYEAAAARTSEHAGELIQPELALFLSLGAEGRRARIDDDEGDLWFTSERLNEAINAFFEREAPLLAPGVLQTIDAGPEASVVCAVARETILAQGPNDA